MPVLGITPSSLASLPGCAPGLRGRLALPISSRGCRRPPKAPASMDTERKIGPARPHLVNPACPAGIDRLDARPAAHYDRAQAGATPRRRAGLARAPMRSGQASPWKTCACDPGLALGWPWAGMAARAGTACPGTFLDYGTGLFSGMAWDEPVRQGPYSHRNSPPRNGRRQCRRDRQDRRA